MVFVVYVLEKLVCVVWFGENEWILCTMCLRRLFVWSNLVKLSVFWCLCAWENGVCVICIVEDKWDLSVVCLRNMFCVLYWKRLSEFCGLWVWEMVFLRIGLVELSDFCCLCAWEGCLCSLVWWKCVILVYYVLENGASEEWHSEIEWFLLPMCLRRLLV